MSNAPEHEKRDQTAVDDVRRVRERLSREAGGDMRRLIEESSKALEDFIRELDLRIVKPPERSTRAEGTHG